MKNVLFLLFVLLSVSCVSKKKYADLETRYVDAKGNLQKLELKFEKIDQRVQAYNDKINSLKSDNVTLEEENALKFKVEDGVPVISKKGRKLMNETLIKIDPKKL